MKQKREKSYRKTMKPKSNYLKNINKTDKHLAMLIQIKRETIQIMNILNEKGDIGTCPINIKKKIMEQ